MRTVFSRSIECQDRIQQARIGLPLGDRLRRKQPNFCNVELVDVDVYDFTEGYCYYCKKKISWKNYGRPGAHGAWEVDHSNPKSRGGTNYLRNLFPTCVECNRDKSTLKGSHYRKKFEPVTFGGKAVEFLGLPEGFLGASRRKTRF